MKLVSSDQLRIYPIVNFSEKFQHMEWLPRVGTLFLLFIIVIKNFVCSTNVKLTGHNIVRMFANRIFILKLVSSYLIDNFVRNFSTWNSVHYQNVPPKGCRRNKESSLFDKCEMYNSSYRIQYLTNFMKMFDIIT